METRASTLLGAMACAGLAGCAAMLPALVLPQAAAIVGVAGLSGVACATDSNCEGPPTPCLGSARQEIEATELAGIAIPADEGRAATFAPAYWQPQFESETGARAQRPAEPVWGTFVVTDKAALFVPRPGMGGVRLPLAGILNVEVQRNAADAPRQLTLESCFGRLDRFTFGQRQQPGRLDSEVTAAAATEIRSRLAALRPAKKTGGNPPAD